MLLEKEKYITLALYTTCTRKNLIARVRGSKGKINRQSKVREIRERGRPKRESKSKS